jgi:hypothetical protein
MEIAAELARQPVDVAAELEQWVADGVSGERANGRANCVRLGPAAVASERLETLEIALVQVDL